MAGVSAAATIDVPGLSSGLASSGHSSASGLGQVGTGPTTGDRLVKTASVALPHPPTGELIVPPLPFPGKRPGVCSGNSLFENFSCFCKLCL